MRSAGRKSPQPPLPVPATRVIPGGQRSSHRISPAHSRAWVCPAENWGPQRSRTGALTCPSVNGAQRVSELKAELLPELLGVDTPPIGSQFSTDLCQKFMRLSLRSSSASRTPLTVLGALMFRLRRQVCLSQVSADRRARFGAYAQGVECRLFPPLKASSRHRGSGLRRVGAGDPLRPCRLPVVRKAIREFLESKLRALKQAHSEGA